MRVKLGRSWTPIRGADSHVRTLRTLLNIFKILAKWTMRTQRSALRAIWAVRFVIAPGRQNPEKMFCDNQYTVVSHAH